MAPKTNVIDIPPSSYRPSPPSSRPQPREVTLRSAPEPEEAPEMAAKKKRTRSPESIAKQKASIRATLAAKKAKKAGDSAPPSRASRGALPSGDLTHNAGEFSAAMVGGKIIDAIAPLVRQIVREEIRRMLS